MARMDRMKDGGRLSARRSIIPSSAFNPVDLKKSCNPVHSSLEDHLAAAADTFAGFSFNCSRMNAGRLVVIPHGFSF
jgi:hypothetical protein